MPTAEESSCPAGQGGATGTILPHPALMRLASIRRQFEQSLIAETPSGAPPSQLEQRSGALACWRSTAKRTLIRVAMFSIVANFAMLTIPFVLFDMADRLLLSGGLGPLLILPLMTIILLAAMAMLDIGRRNILNGLAASMETILGGAILSALMISRPAQERGYVETLRRLHDVRGFLTSPTTLLLFDASMLPLFFATIIFINPGLGTVVMITAFLLGIAALRRASLLYLARPLAAVAIIGWDVHLALAGTLTIGMAIASSIIAGRALLQVDNLMGARKASMKAWAAYGNVCRVLEEIPSPAAEDAPPSRSIPLKPATTNVLPFGKSKPKGRHIAMSC